jgi:hypothetical protein
MKHILFSHVPLFPKAPELPQCSRYSFLKINHITHSSFQDPQSHHT